MTINGTVGRAIERPLYFDLPDLMIIDKGQAEAFHALGALRAPFANWSTWPTLDELFRKFSIGELDRTGSERWRAHGGVLDSSGVETCETSSPLATKALASVVDGKGGIIWKAREGRTHAVRLCRSDDAQNLLGFAIGWPTHGVPPQIRLGRLAQQFLFLVHAQVLSQRRSAVFLPDELLGQVAWGEPRTKWPKNWRQEILRVLLSLMELSSEVFRLSAPGWRPRLGKASTVLSCVEDLRVLRPDEDQCRQECPMSRYGARHHHLLVEIGPGFLGVLEHFALPSDHRGYREYDFVRIGSDASESQTAIQEARKNGRIISVSTSAAVLANSKWSGFSPQLVSIIQAIEGERTRRPQFVHGSQVPGTQKSERLTCPLLSPAKRYVAFCGNGHRPGQGYLVVGTKGRGWMKKCGFAVPECSQGVISAVRTFLDRLDEVRNSVDIVIVGLNTKTKTWLSWSEIRALNTGSLIAELPTLHLRIYASEGFDDRLRQHLAVRGRFGAIGHETTGDFRATQNQRLNDMSGRQLADIVLQLRVSQQELADEIGVTQSFISQLVREVRPWPEPIREKVIAVLRERMSRSRR